MKEEQASGMARVSEAPAAGEAPEYFELGEDYEAIALRTLSEAVGATRIDALKPIDTGWTNIVCRVSCDKGDFYFRFPRDSFWERVIVKDCEFARYIDGKTSYKTVQLHLGHDQGRPFSFHREIPGVPLAERMNTMSDADVVKVSRQISQWMQELHALSFDPATIFSVDNISLHLQGFIDELLTRHVSEADRAFWRPGNDFEEEPEGTCLVHGDFNSSNVLIDENNNVAAFIDFGFAGFGSKYFDIARIIGRCPARFKQPIIDAYEEFQGKPLNMPTLNKDIDIWTNIDQGYINYMHSCGIQ